MQARGGDGDECQVGTRPEGCPRCAGRALDGCSGSEGSRGSPKEARHDAALTRVKKRAQAAKEAADENDKKAKDSGDAAAERARQGAEDIS